MVNLLILMQVVKAFLQEWAILVPVVDYMMDTAPQGAPGISARDLRCSYSIATQTDVRLALFKAPTGLPETTVAA